MLCDGRMDSKDIFCHYLLGHNIHTKFPPIIVKDSSYQPNIIIAGGYYNSQYYDDVLRYYPEEDTIFSVGHMRQARTWHAVSVVLVQDYSQWCD